MIRGNTMFIKDFISYFDIIFPLFILYLFFLLIAYIKNKNNKEYLLPAIKDVIIETDIDNNVMVIRPLKGIFDDEN